MDKEITSFLITRILQLEAKHEATKGAIGLLADKAGIPHEEIWEMIEDAARKSFQKHRSSICATHPAVRALLEQAERESSSPLQPLS